MKVISLKLDGAKIIEPAVYGDHRGFFTESYNDKLFHDNDIKYNFLQDNHSLSAEAGVLRGCIIKFHPKPKLS